MKKTYCVDSVEKYNRTIKSLIDELVNNHRIDEQKTVLVYRGHSDSQYRLIPSLGRPIKPKKPLWISNESEIIERSLNDNYQLFSVCNNPVEELTIMQHYGLPTRLLDVTENPLVALYFACCDHSDLKGEVFVMKADRDIPDHNLYQAVGATWRLYTKGDSVADVVGKMTHESFYKEDDTAINPLSEADIVGRSIQILQYRAKHFVNPDRLTSRQEAQEGRYLLFSNRTNIHTGKISNQISRINKTDDMVLMRLEIEPQNKRTILKELEILGIEKSNLFPDEDIPYFGMLKNEIEERYR